MHNFKYILSEELTESMRSNVLVTGGLLKVTDLQHGI